MIYCKGCRGAYEITDEIFAEITSYNLNRTKDIIQKLFDELQIGWEQIDGVLLVGLYTHEAGENISNGYVWKTSNERR